ncbi:2-amino-4-hydroxy-6-hydroxymethyldihydropteridine pyrophosphokinase [Photobacterium gaetbulicola]|uniref:2-amino-4-hydroxy-6-hydroxymethyldihydropteridine diphosphokinase n=1 Tax=Photobacterium gaetbulicola TaxID=1295392 RepID=A0A0B9GA81_9GAMM|nr:2-amino-4-hydroxy-6-hydroxymethyldihydropteridine diphosphokinase [Photobacterium gaetbulicola]KHT65504.1 2-amino-4-hydroxy-6-hydroxymethyldihydropteridine pyrophosphokinase [Photobacterium gaetbulicola]
MTTVYISLGSNIDRERHLMAGLAGLSKLGSGMQVSTIYEAEPVGFSGPNFFNCVAVIETSLSLDTLWQALKQLELQHGRAADAAKNQSRTLDLDILLYGETVQETYPVLPRSDIYKFAFVLQPLMELCPHREIPGDGRTVTELWHASRFEQALWPVEHHFVV